ncbi:uncharacterized protein C8R40DRAFT_1095746 [Lentinula edodes]|uniref:uncharacterized protein n=1 Tax=Lentinula edodes TaxID=5353 RepID=UPI001E8CEA62|nr:uncharacterized protein C8R40DRAFT_1095746 [Lentinula edodes]KAH7877358.1 hypothetical protein C8R40DRAFT_1095746 [Lentinula edodes]
MSHSTIVTATYTLVKYSRFYPNSAQGATSDLQHYTKPTLKFILDVEKSITRSTSRYTVTISVLLRQHRLAVGEPSPCEPNR